jgi:hypothetical protein
MTPSPVVAEVVVPSASVLSAVPRGEVLSTLKQGDKVEQVARFDGFFLVRNAGSASNLGWVVRYAFEAGASEKMAALPLPKKCGKIRASVAQGDTTRCAYWCKNTLECGDTGTCEAAMLVPVQPGPVTPTFTTVCTPDPSKPRPKVTLAPFGSPHTFDGGCPEAFAKAPEIGTLCYRLCSPKQSNCPVDSECVKSKSGKFCFAHAE